MNEHDVFQELFSRMSKVAEGTRNDMVTHLDVHTLSEQERSAGHTPEAKIAIIRQYFKAHNLNEEASLYTLTPEQAKLVLRKSLTDSAAYDGDDVHKTEPSEEADAIVQAFFAKFDNNHTTFVSLYAYGHVLAPDGAYGFNSLTRATCESGIVAIDNDKLVMVCFEEED